MPVPDYVSEARKGTGQKMAKFLALLDERNPSKSITDEKNTRKVG